LEGVFSFKTIYLRSLATTSDGYRTYLHKKIFLLES